MHERPLLAAKLREAARRINDNTTDGYDAIAAMLMIEAARHIEETANYQRIDIEEDFRVYTDHRWPGLIDKIEAWAKRHDEVRCVRVLHPTGHREGVEIRMSYRDRNNLRIFDGLMLDHYKARDQFEFIDDVLDRSLIDLVLMRKVE